MSAFLKIVLQFALAATDPHQSCELAHRDPGIAATYYLYCSQTLADGTEVVSVGKFVPDSAIKAP